MYTPCTNQDSKYLFLPSVLHGNSEMSSNRPVSVIDIHNNSWIPAFNLPTSTIQTPTIKKGLLVNVSPNIATNGYSILQREVQLMYDSGSTQTKLLLNKSADHTKTCSTTKENALSPKCVKLQTIPVSQINQDNSIKISTSSSNSKSTDDYEENGNRKLASESICYVCNKTFGSFELLDEHKNSKVFYCRVCAQQLVDHAELETHFTKHKSLKCNKCNKLFYSKKDLLQHKKVNKECNILVECEMCNKKVTKKSLNHHKKIFHRKSSSDEFKCQICGKNYNFASKLFNHLIRSHIAYVDLECKLCKKLLWGPHRLLIHMKNVHLEPTEDGSVVVCQVCKKQFNRQDSLNIHLKIHDNVEKLCEVCGVSVQERAMKRHMQIKHSEGKVFPCKKCSEQFDSYEKVLQHNRKIHNKRADRSPVYCEICGKKYKDSMILKTHTLSVHSEEKPFKCETCGASFKLKVTLRTHQRVHSNVGKYFCAFCGESFRWQQTFVTHVKKCETESTEVHLNKEGVKDC